MELSESKKLRERLNVVRPQQLNLSELTSTSYKWAECKVLGKNISIRSYAGSCTDGVYLYVYGGLQILKSTLSDFTRIRLNPQQEKFQWEEVPVANPQNSPGPRAKHALVYCKQRIYLVGGICSGTEICNDLHEYEVASKRWKKLEPKGDPLPPIQSFGCCYLPGEQDRIVVCCGYQGRTCSPTSDVYCYSIQQNSWKRLYDSSSHPEGPIGRSGCGCSYDGAASIYIFGGKADDRLNDLWRFDLQANMFSRVKDTEDMRPNVRNGHSMNFFDGKLYVFGGIHEVTWELDDLHIFDVKDCKWTTLEVDSARKKQSTAMPKLQDFAVHQVKQQPVRECFSATRSKERHYHNGANLSKAQNYDVFDEVTSSDRNSPNKMRDQQRKKAFMHKKAQLLKTFELPETEKPKFIFVEPASQAMKNSLDLIGSVSNVGGKSKAPHKITQFGRTTYSKFMQPLVNNTNVVTGKRPCARDGHSAVMMGTELIFFGGDRHQMSFNDLYKLNMLVVRRQFEQGQH